MRKGITFMKQHALVDSYNACKEQTETIMTEIFALLQQADIPLRSNRHLTEIVVDSTKEEIIEKVGDAAFVDKIHTFGIALFEHSGKTYIRLKYK